MAQDYKGVRPETLVRKIDGVPQGEHGKSSKAEGLFLVATTSDLPDASTLPEGCVVYDSLTNQLKIVVGGAYKVSQTYS
jgi:hypothetical protein